MTGFKKEEGLLVISPLLARSYPTSAPRLRSRIGEAHKWLFQVKVNVRGEGGKCCPLVGDTGSGFGKGVDTGLAPPPSPALNIT